MEMAAQCLARGKKSENGERGRENVGRVHIDPILCGALRNDPMLLLPIRIFLFAQSKMNL